MNFSHRRDMAPHARRLLTPTKEIALRLLAVGPICGEWSGAWKHPDFADKFNSHTIGHLVFLGFAEFDHPRATCATTAEITQEGRDYLRLLEGLRHDRAARH